MPAPEPAEPAPQPRPHLALGEDEPRRWELGEHLTGEGGGQAPSSCLVSTLAQDELGQALGGRATSTPTDALVTVETNDAPIDAPDHGPSRCLSSDEMGLRPLSELSSPAPPAEPANREDDQAPGDREGERAREERREAHRQLIPIRSDHLPPARVRNTVG
jgi:hypothetical protein